MTGRIIEISRRVTRGGGVWIIHGYPWAPADWWIDGLFIGFEVYPMDKWIVQGKIASSDQSLFLF